jgi:tetratricopeptide (TPR) repeat protein
MSKGSLKRRLGRPVLAAGLEAAVLFTAREIDRWMSARAQFAEGREALGRRDLPGAAARFQQALEVAPRWIEARLSLATVYAAQYVPGGESPRNLGLAKQALDEFHRVLERSPGNREAIRRIAALHDGQLDYVEAEKWYRHLAALTPPSAGAFADLSRTSWKRVSAAILDARARQGLPPEESPIADAGVRDTLRTRWSRAIDEGIAHASQAIAIEPEHADAMTTMAAWHRVRADIAGTTDEFQRDVKGADDWVRKVRALRLTRTEQPR